MTRFLLAILLLGLAGVAGAAPQKMVFEGTHLDCKWALKDVSPDLPSDWSKAQFLTLEFRASSAQRFELRIFTAAGTRKLRVHPFQGAWTRVSIPISMLDRPASGGTDLASMSNRSLPSVFINLMGSSGPVSAVQAMGVAMDNPLGQPTFEIRSARLTQDAQNAVLDPKPLVDEFGQWISEQWPGKAANLEDLKKAWAAEEAALRPGAFNTCPYGGDLGTKAKATGFFRVEQVGGKWWFVDPDGHLFFSVGSDCMNPSSGTPTAGRDGVFAAQPPADLRPPRKANSRRPNRASFASFYTWNLARRFGPEWPAKWIDLAARRMDDWGLNTIGNWSDSRLWDAHKKAYAVNISGWGRGADYMGMPDVFSAEFAQAADATAAAECAPRKSDPWLLGYFIANEPPWPGRELQLVELILAGGPTATQRELKAFLAQGDTPERRKEFVYRAFEKYIDVTGNAIRKHDPNHLNLGLRFGGRAPEPMLRATRRFDVFSMNSYSVSLDKQYIDKVYEVTGRPVLIGEFHFGTPGRGLSAGLRQTANQAERGVAYRYYVEQAAALPMLVGVHWFQWIDEPNTGRSDGENYNIGMIDVTDQPYRELVEGVKATARRVIAVHAGKEAPVSQKAQEK